MSSSGLSDSEGEGPIPSAGTPACLSTSSQHHDDNAFLIRFPSQTTYQCPVCELWYNILPSLRRHVKKSHPAYLYQELFACDVCGYETETLKSVNSHVKTQHGTVNPPEAPNGAFQCPHCVMRFPSKVSCSQHVRGRHMDEACQARANAVANLSDGKRKTWDPVEVDKFKSALLQFGPLSNVAIANAIGTRTCKQVGVFKRSFLLKNPTWLVDNTPPVPQSPKPPPYSTAVNSNSNLILPRHPRPQPIIPMFILRLRPELFLCHPRPPPFNSMFPPPPLRILFLRCPPVRTIFLLPMFLLLTLLLHLTTRQYTSVVRRCPRNR